MEGNKREAKAKKQQIQTQDQPEVDEYTADELEMWMNQQIEKQREKIEEYKDTNQDIL